MNINIEKILLKLLTLDQWELNKEKHVRDYIKGLIPEIQEDLVGNLFISNPGKPILSAHMDWVHSFDNENVITIKDWVIRSKNKMWLNADDRCWIAIAVATYLEDPSSCWLLFTIEEETGMQGASHFVEHSPEFLREHTYCIVLDRKGSWDIIWAANDYCSEVFETWFANVSKPFGYKPAIGVACDADNFNEEINCVNLSIGYYDAHTALENVNIVDFKHAYKTVKFMVAQPISKSKLKVVPAERYNWWRMSKTTDWGSYEPKPYSEEYFGDDPAIATNDDDRKFADLNLCPECWAEILKEDIMYGNCGICLAKIPDDIMSAATFI